MSTRSSYAIRALITLARQPAEAFARLSTVAQEQHIPLPYLEQIFAKLRKAGLVDASRGPQGGYKLMKNPADITLAEIVYVLEGPPEPVLCSLPENRSPNCHHEEGCMSRFLCNELDGALARVLRSNTLATMAGQTAGAAIPAPRPADAGWQPIKIATKGA